MKLRAIVFVGMDGAGKSTLSHTLGSDLRNRGMDVCHIWVLENEQSLLRRFLRRIAPATFTRHSTQMTEPGITRSSSGWTGSLFRRLYPAIVTVDYMVYGLVRIRLPSLWSRHRVWIFDRYFFDVILSLSDEFNLTTGQSTRMWSLLGVVFPVPDIIFFIDVEPEVALGRKPDAYPSLDAASIMRQRYLGLLDTLNHRYGLRILRIDNNSGAEKSYEEIRKGIEIRSGQVRHG